MVSLGFLDQLEMAMVQNFSSKGASRGRGNSRRLPTFGQGFSAWSCNLAELALAIVALGAVGGWSGGCGRCCSGADSHLHGAGSPAVGDAGTRPPSGAEPKGATPVQVSARRPQLMSRCMAGSAVVE